MNANRTTIALGAALSVVLPLSAAAQIPASLTTPDARQHRDLAPGNKIAPTDDLDLTPNVKPPFASAGQGTPPASNFTGFEEPSAAARYLSIDTSKSDDGNGVEAPVGWRFLIGIPLWLPAVDGDLSVDGFTFSARQDTGDVFDNLDAHVNLAISLHVEAQKDRLGVFGVLEYIDLGVDRDTRIGTTQKASIDGYIAEVGLLYTLFSTSPANRRGAPVRLDLLGGLRVTSIGIDIDTQLLGSGGDSRTLWDPFIGLRGEVGLLKWLSLKGRADVGGFDAFGADSSHLTWQASAAASLHLARWCTLDAGYRWLSYDYEDGSGLDRFELDALLHGPFIEIAFKF